MLKGMAVRVVLAGAIGVLLLAGVAGLVTVDEDGSNVSTSGTTSTSVESEGGAPVPGTLVPYEDPNTTVTSAAPPADPAPVTTVAPMVTGTTAAPAASPAVPGPAKAPAAGTYTYSLARTGDAPQMGPDRLTVEARGTDGGRVRQRVATTRGGFPTTNEVVWDGASAVIERTTVNLAGIEIVCQWNRPVLLYAAGLRSGTQWTVDSACTGRVSASVCGELEYRVRQTGANAVTGSGTVSVDKTAVRAWQIKRSNWTLEIFAMSTLCSISSTLILQGQEQFAAEQGLVASSDDTIATSTATNDVRSSTNAREVRNLGSLRPS